MPAAVLERIFPNLRAGGYTITSPIDPEYNCAAFAAGESEEWWDPYSPDGVWPSAVDRDVFLQNFELVFELEGFEICADGSVEQGFEKIVLYADAVGEFCHAARQLPSGAWMSKLGELEDIEHATLDALICPQYGKPTRFMKRRTIIWPFSNAS